MSNEPWYGRMMECDRCAYMDRRDRRYLRAVYVACAAVWIIAAVIFGIFASQ